MSAPRRWIEEGGSATPFERDLLRSALSIEPPPGARSEILAALLTRVPPPGGAGASGATGATGNAAAAAKAAATKAAALGAAGGILKGVLIGAGSAVVLIATYSAIAPTPRAVIDNPAAHAPRPITAPRVAAPQGHPSDSLAASPAEAPPEARPEAAPPPAVAPIGAPIGGADHRAAPAPSASDWQANAPAPAAADETGGETSRETMLREENHQMSEARAAMRRGDAPGALTLLDQVRARFPGGVLVQEREALAIEALARSGRRGDAAARAAAFLKAYPTSMFADRVQAFAR